MEKRYIFFILALLFLIPLIIALKISSTDTSYYIQPKVNLSSGWNAFGLILNSSYYVTGDMSINLSIGDNLLGYSSNKSINLRDVYFCSTKRLYENISLSTNWTLIALQFYENSSFNDDVRIPINVGWNLLGQSSQKPFYIRDVTFTNSTNSNFTYNELINKSIIIALNVYRNQTQLNLITPSLINGENGKDTKFIYPGEGYWLKMGQSGNLTIPNIGGAKLNLNISVLDINISNGTLELNITDAGNPPYEWIDIINGFDSTGAKTYDPQLPGFSDLYDLDSWSGYWINTKKSNITLIRRFSNPQKDLSNCYIYEDALGKSKIGPLKFSNASLSTNIGRLINTIYPSDAFWLNSNEVGNLTFPGVGGTNISAIFNWNKLRFSNGTVELNVTEASNVTNAWINSTLRYWNGSSYNNICGNGLCDKTNISSWEGVFISSNKNNITLINDNSTKPQIAISSPTSRKYLINQSINFNYTVNDINLESCWYYIFNSTSGYEISNTTLTNCGDTIFNVSIQDTFTLFLHANNSQTSNSINVSFSGTTKPQINLL